MGLARTVHSKFTIMNKDFFVYEAFLVFHVCLGTRYLEYLTVFAGTKHCVKNGLKSAANSVPDRVVEAQIRAIFSLGIHSSFLIRLLTPYRRGGKNNAGGIASHFISFLPPHCGMLSECVRGSALFFYLPLQGGLRKKETSYSLTPPR